MSFRRSVVWMGASQGFLFILQFGTSVILARLLTPYEMGIYASAAAVIGVLGILQAFGIKTFIIREPTIDADLLASAFTINLLVSVFVGILVVGFSVTAGMVFREPGIRHVTLVLATIPLIGIFEFLPAARLERDSQFRLIAMMGLIRTGITSITIVALAVSGFSYMSMAWGQIVGAVASVVGFMIWGRQFVSYRLALAGWRQITVFGLQQLSIQGVSVLALRISDLLIGRLLGLSALGLYSRASNLVSLLWYSAQMILGRVILVDLAAHHRAGLDLRERYLRTVEVISALLWPSFGGFAILAGPVIYIVYGPAWIAAAPPLSLLAIASIGFISLGAAWDVLIICNHMSKMVRIEWTRSVVGLILFAIGSTFGLAPAAAMRLVESIIAVAMYLPAMESVTGARRSDFLRIFRRSATATVLCCSPAFILMTVYNWSPHVPVGLVAAVIVAGGVIWMGVLTLQDHPLSHEFRRVVAESRRVAGAWSGIR